MKTEKSMRYKYLSWEEIEKLCLLIRGDMHKNNYIPDYIVGVLWGGAVPTRLFADLFDIPRANVKLVWSNLYMGIDERKESPSMTPFYDSREVANKKVLLIDDIYDTGKTIQHVKKDLLLSNCNVTSATLLYKSINNVTKPDYFGWEITEEKLWVVYPWEKQEFARLMCKLQKENPL